MATAAVADPWKIYKYGDPEILRLTSKDRFLTNQVQDYQQILSANRGSGWTDPEYPHTGQSVGDLQALRDSANANLPMGGGDSAQWIRIKDWIQNQANATVHFKNMPEWNGSETPVFNNGDFSNGLARHDIRQGLTGDCWFVASVSAVAVDLGVMRRLVPSDNVYNDSGVYHFVFWFDGIWIDVPVDDYIPCKLYTDNLMPVGCSIPKTEEGQAEFWVPLLEKAYAKLMGNYQEIASNSAVYGLENLAGGFTESINLRDGSMKPGTFEQIQEEAGKRSILVLSCPNVPQNEAVGLVGPHCYSITSVHKVYEYGKRPIKLAKILNPHGHGEWNGDWSDPKTEDSRWNNVSDEEKEALGVQTKDEGEFFMEWETLPQWFTGIDIVNLIRESEVKDPNAIVEFSAYHGEWSVANGTAGGLNGLGNCPQYTVTVDSQDPSGLAVLFIGIMYKGPIKSRIPDVYGAYVNKVDTPKEPPYDNHFFYRADNTEQKPVEGEAYERAARTMSRAYKLEPGKYVITPYSQTEGKEGKFFLRILAQTKGAWKTD